MMSRISIDESDLSAISRYAATVEDIVAVYVFGSYAREQAGPLSDIDVAVLLRPTVAAERYLDARLQCMHDMANILQRNDVDIVILNEAPLALGYRVLRDGKLLFCGDRATLTAFKATTITRYLDFQPIIERHERAIVERARQGALLRGHNPHRGALERYRRLRERLARVAGSDV